MLLRFLETLLISLAGGLIFRLLCLPLPWLLGATTATILWRLAAKRKTVWPLWLRNLGLIILGYMLGSSFTIETGKQIISQLPAMLLATTLIILFSLLVGYITYRRTGISLATSIIGSVPGGLTQMVILSEEIADTDLTIVTFMQTLRLISTVFIIPFIVMHGLARDAGQALPGNTAGMFISDAPWTAILFIIVVLLAALVSVRIKLPTPYLLGPLLGAAILVLAGFQAPATPPSLVFISQLSIGTYLGLTINPDSLENWKKLLPYALGGSVAVVFFSLGVGYLLTRLHALDLISAFLGTSPGGMGEMGLTAVLVGANVSLVTRTNVPPLIYPFCYALFVKKAFWQ